MKIAIMMRAMDQDSGLRVYAEQLVDSLLRIDEQNEYLLLYRTEKWFHRYSAFKNAKEVLLTIPHKFLWDQVAVPRKAWEEKVDIIFNPKFSVPLISHCPVAMSLREPAWWIWPEHYEWLDRNYMRLMLPVYIKKSSYLFPISKFVLDENAKIFNLPSKKISIAYPGPNKHFRVIHDFSKLDEFKKKYKLPEKFILGVTRVDHPGLEKSTSYFPGKNVETTIRAFLMCRDKTDWKLVIAGRHVEKYLLDSGWSPTDLQEIHFVGFVPHNDMPLLYNLADLFLIPSYYEGFGQAVVEAMSCGCPVIASTTGSLPEVSGGATLLADPKSPQDYAEKIMLVLGDKNLQDELRAKGIKRASFFDWKKTAQIILDGLIKAITMD